MTVTYSLTYDPRPRLPLSAEERARVEARAPRDEDIVFDEDCPELTDAQLAQFRRVHPRPRGEVRADGRPTA